MPKDIAIDAEKISAVKKSEEDFLTAFTASEKKMTEVPEQPSKMVPEQA